MFKTQRTIALVLLLGSALQAQSWIRNSANGHYYALTAPMSWAQAEALAIKWGGHLVTIESSAENAWLTNTGFPQSFRDPFGVWIGYNDAAKEGTWVWSSGEPVTFTHWRSGEPNNANGGEDHAHMYGGKFIGSWNDRIEGTAAAGNLQPGIVEIAGLAAFSTFGKGCASTATLPVVSAATPPRLGRYFTLSITGFISQPFGYLILGSSNTSWGSTPLPFDLKPIGGDGCSLLVSLESSSKITINALGNAPISIPIPSTVSLLGTTVYGQAWARDSQANPLGIATTNGFKAVIGS